MALSFRWVLSAALMAHTVGAQTTCPVRGDTAKLPFDGVVAAVGTTSVTWYDVCDRLRAFEQQRRGAGSTRDEQRARIDSSLHDFVDETLLLVKAKELGVAVPDAAVIPEGERLFREARAKFATQAEFEQQLVLAGYWTPEVYQQVLNECLRRQRTFEAMARKLSDEKLVSRDGDPRVAAEVMRRYLDRLSKETVVAVYPERAYALAGVR